MSVTLQPSISDIDARTYELFAEFDQHYSDLCAAEGRTPARELVYQAWSMKKLAEIQINLEATIAAVNRLVDVQSGDL